MALDDYIDNRMTESQEIRDVSDDFYNKIADIANSYGEQPRKALKEAIFFLCERYGCEEILTTPFVLQEK